MKDYQGFSRAFLMALLNGDDENAMVAATPGGIEAQEARGQQQFVNTSTLPIEVRNGTYEAHGITVGEPVDDLFVSVTLPDGWKKVPTSHSMWSDLIDEQGRVRASIFYKAAFYDRSAFASLREIPDAAE